MNKLTAEKCREQFEARIRNLDGDYNLIRVGEVYIDVETQIEWRTWQAAWNKALEIALPILEQQERGEWIEWSGGECPVPPRKIVDLKLRKGSITTGYPAGSAQWDHRSEDDDTDIIAYRIIPQRPTNQNGEQ